MLHLYYRHSAIQAREAAHRPCCASPQHELGWGATESTAKLYAVCITLMCANMLMMRVLLLMMLILILVLMTRAVHIIMMMTIILILILMMMMMRKRRRRREEEEEEEEEEDPSGQHTKKSWVCSSSECMTGGFRFLAMAPGTAFHLSRGLHLRCSRLNVHGNDEQCTLQTCW